MVISGNNDFKPDVLKAKEVVSLLIDDESLKQKLEQAQDSKKLQVEKRKQAAAQKKVSWYAQSVFWCTAQKDNEQIKPISGCFHFYC